MKTLRLLLPLAVIAYLASGFYVVGPDEQAVVRSFGRVVGSPRLPGLQYDLPWGLSRVDRLKPAETKRITVGYAYGGGGVRAKRGPRSSDAGPSLRSDPAVLGPQSEFLTGDQNILHVQATVQYTVSSAVAYVLRAADVDRLLACSVEGALSEAIARQGVDFVRAEGGSQLQQSVLARLQAQCEQYGLGVTVRSVNLDRVLPPEPVVDFFRQASDARNLRDLLIHQAEADARRLVQEARSRAQETLDAAAGFTAQVVQQAQGSSQRFLALAEEYRHSKSLTTTRLFLESMERILPRLRAKIIVQAGEQVNLSILRKSEP